MAFNIFYHPTEVTKKISILDSILRRGIAVGIAHSLFQMTQHAFQDQQSPEGTAWTPLSPGYSKIKSRLFPGKPMLQAHRGLFRSLFEHAEGNRAIIGATMPYAAVHQFGGVAGRSGPFKKKDGKRAQIPARPFLPSIETAEREALRLAQEIIADANRRAGLE